MLVRYQDKLFQQIHKISLWFFIPPDQRPIYIDEEEPIKQLPFDQVFMEEYRNYLGCDVILINQTHVAFCKEIHQAEIVIEEHEQNLQLGPETIST